MCVGDGASVGDGWGRELVGISDERRYPFASCSASPIFCKAMKVVSPASIEGQMVDGGVFKMEIRYVTVCYIKSRRVT